MVSLVHTESGEPGGLAHRLPKWGRFCKHQGGPFQNPPSPDSLCHTSQPHRLASRLLLTIFRGKKSELREISGLSLRPPASESGIKARGLDRLLTWVASIGAGTEACPCGQNEQVETDPRAGEKRGPDREGWGRQRYSKSHKRRERDGPDQGGRVLGTELVRAQGQGKAERIQAKVGRRKLLLVLDFLFQV